MRVLTTVLVALLLVSLVTAQKGKGKTKGKSKGKGKASKGKGKGGSSKIPKKFKPFTASVTGEPCWWDMTKKTDCAKCKAGGSQCGYPLHMYCFEKDQPCPGMLTPQTLSTRGHPCFWDHSSTDCAWCAPGMAQVGPKGSKISRRGGGHCFDPKSKKAPPIDKVMRMTQSCKYFGKDICDSMAECNEDTGKCECKSGWTGNGVQCVDENGNFASGDQVSVRMTMTNELFLSDGSLEFPVGPSSDNLFSEMESLANGAIHCSINGCSYNRTSTTP